MNKILLLIICLMPVLSIAKVQPIKVRAQTVVIEEQKGQSTYTGDASMVQGSLILAGEKIQLFTHQTKLTKVIVEGRKKRRAHYQQNQPNQPDFIKATAKKIVYLIDKKIMRLSGKAQLTQGADSFSGDTLEYDIKQDRVIIKQSEDNTQKVRFNIKL